MQVYLNTIIKIAAIMLRITKWTLPFTPKAQLIHTQNSKQRNKTNLGHLNTV